jgi:hypothetical protein
LSQTVGPERSAQTMPGRQKVSALVLGNLALAYIQARKLDEATATLHDAIDVVEPPAVVAGQRRVRRRPEATPLARSTAGPRHPRPAAGPLLALMA